MGQISKGSYTFSSQSQEPFIFVKSTGYLVVNSSNINILMNVTSSKSFVIAFTETGLLPGTQWGVIVDNGFVYSSNSLAGIGLFNGVGAPLTYTLCLPNGTYSVQGFVIGQSRYTSFTSPISISVNGKLSKQTVSFGNSGPNTGNSAAIDTGLEVAGGVALGIAAVGGYMYIKKKPPFFKPKSS